jgi:hypothetical protein
VYVSLDYSSALSVLQLQPGGGVQVQSLPRSRRYAVSGLIHLTRHFSLLVTGEETRQGDTAETRAMLGLTYRF